MFDCLIGAQNEPGKIAVNRADSLAICQGFNREWELQGGARSGSGNWISLPLNLYNMYNCESDLPKVNNLVDTPSSASFIPNQALSPYSLTHT